MFFYTARRAIAPAGLLLSAAIVLSGCSASSTPAATRIPTTAPPATAAAVDSRTLTGDAHNTLTTADDSRVTIVEFADYECPPCARLSGDLERLARDYAGRITIIVRNYPLPMHDSAIDAARSAEAAGRQAHFAGMYEALFAGQSTWKDLPTAEAAAVFRGYASTLGLDMARYDSDVASPEVAALVERDLADGTRSGVQGTPTLFVNNQRTEMWTYEQMAATVDRLLAS